MNKKVIISIIFLSLQCITQTILQGTKNTQKIKRLSDKIINMIQFNRNLEEWKQITKNDACTVFTQIQDEIKKYETLKQQIYKVSYETQNEKIDQGIKYLELVLNESPKLSSEELIGIKTFFFDFYDMYTTHKTLTKTLSQSSFRYCSYFFLPLNYRSHPSTLKKKILQNNKFFFKEITKDNTKDSCYICTDCLENASTFESIIDHMQKKHLIIEHTGCMGLFEEDNLEEDWEEHYCSICKEDCKNETHFGKHIKKIKLTSAITLLSPKQSISDESFSAKHYTY